MPDEFLSNSHKQDLIQQFIDRTSSSNAGELSARNKAKFHLESAQWNLEVFSWFLDFMLFKLLLLL